MAERPIRSRIAFALMTGGGLVALLLLIVVIYGYTTRPGWVGVANKTVWDWLELFIVPIALAIAGFLLSDAAQRQRDLDQRERELALENRRTQEEALQAYLDQMKDFLVDQADLPEELPSDNYRVRLVQARTIAVLATLDRTRKRIPLKLIAQLELINRDRPFISLKNADLDDADLQEVTLLNVSLREAALRGANLTGADLRESDLTWADLRGADLTRAVLVRACLAHANLLPYDRDNPAQLNAPHLLNGSDPSHAARWRKKLPATRLDDANLQEADLSGAFLYRASLSSTELSGAYLKDADLRGADLRGADLSGADLSGAEVTEEQLAECRSLEGATMPNGQKY